MRVYQFHMMRIISGTLVNVGMGKLSEEAVADMIRQKPAGQDGRQPKVAGAYCAPPHGLCLDAVFYRD